MGRESSAKFIARNRKPRVHIEYEVDIGDATEKIELPFILGVMSDLSGNRNPEDPLPEIADRKFTEVDKDNFESFLKKSKPRVCFQVKNTMTGEGNLNVEMTFQSMADFSPAAVARKVEALNRLFTLRNQLSELLTKMDGRDKAEKLMNDFLKQPALIKQLAGEPGAKN
jgi:type VI secretion system protein ImpB